MSKIQKIALFLITLWAVAIWSGFYIKKSNAAVQWAEFIPSNAFAQWEAEGRLNLIDSLLYDEVLVSYRKNWGKGDKDLIALADYIINLQMNAYGIKSLKPAKLKIIPMTGNANGFYAVDEKVIFLNDLMKWTELPIERFFEVVLHENMHHILTYAIKSMDKKDLLYSDFKGFYYSGMASKEMQHHDIHNNPQELVAYQSQRAGRYVGLFHSDLSVWAISERTKEINEISKILNYSDFSSSQAF
jgi:hypothetical protein